MREINKIIVHCSDTRTNQSFSIDTINEWHKKRGFSKEYKGKVYNVGYHYYIRLNGNIEMGRPIEISGAHCKGHNSDSIGICFEGGLDNNGNKWSGPTEEQIKSYKILEGYLEFSLFGVIDVYGHNELSNKTCPNFDVKEVL